MTDLSLIEGSGGYIYLRFQPVFSNTGSYPGPKFFSREAAWEVVEGKLWLVVGEVVVGLLVENFR